MKLNKNADPDKYVAILWQQPTNCLSVFDNFVELVLKGLFGVKFLFLLQAIVYHWMLIMEKKDILVLGKRLTDGLDDTKITAEGKYSVTTTKSRKKTCLSLHYNAANSFYYASGEKIH